MSLNFDLSHIANYGEVCFHTLKEDSSWSGGKKGERVIKPLTNALIWATMGVGIGEITEENALQFYSRVHLQEKLFGTNLNGSEGPYWITYEDVRSHIGLKTNVFPMETDAKWGARVVRQFQREQQTTIERAAQKAEQGRADGSFRERT